MWSHASTILIDSASILTPVSMSRILVLPTNGNIYSVGLHRVIQVTEIILDPPHSRYVCNVSKNNSIVKCTQGIEQQINLDYYKSSYNKIRAW